MSAFCLLIMALTARLQAALLQATPSRQRSRRAQAPCSLPYFVTCLIELQVFCRKGRSSRPSIRIRCWPRRSLSCAAGGAPGALIGHLDRVGGKGARWLGTLVHRSSQKGRWEPRRLPPPQRGGRGRQGGGDTEGGLLTLQRGTQLSHLFLLSYVAGSTCGLRGWRRSCSAAAVRGRPPQRAASAPGPELAHAASAAEPRFAAGTGREDTASFAAGAGRGTL